MKSDAQTPGTSFKASQPSAKSIAERIRYLRRERGWSLADVERLSRGTLKAVVLGSYERGDRAISLNRAIQLATLFSVPLVHLLCAPEKTPPSPRSTMMIDLRRARFLMENSTNHQDQTLQIFGTFIAWIANRRCDWNGEVMSLRNSDLGTLALMTYMSEDGLLAWLNRNELLITELNRL